MKSINFFVFALLAINQTTFAGSIADMFRLSRELQSSPTALDAAQQQMMQFQSIQNMMNQNYYDAAAIEAINARNRMIAEQAQQAMYLRQQQQRYVIFKQKAAKELPDLPGLLKKESFINFLTQRDLGAGMNGLMLIQTTASSLNFDNFPTIRHLINEYKSTNKARNRKQKAETQMWQVPQVESQGYDLKPINR